GIQQGLEAGVEHRKARRELGALLAYNPRLKAGYEEAMGELESVSLPFLDRMESYKDVPLDRIMDTVENRLSSTRISFTDNIEHAAK
ncbi:hypothetical protein Tco_0574850, partial [Tanacetum coccineum]